MKRSEYIYSFETFNF